MLHLIALAAPHVDDSIQSDFPQLPVVGRNLLYDALKCFQRPSPSLEGRAAAVVIAEFFHLPLTLGRHESGQPAAHGIIGLFGLFKTRFRFLTHLIGQGLPPIQNQSLTKPHISSGQLIIGVQLTTVGHLGVFVDFFHPLFQPLTGIKEYLPLHQGLIVQLICQIKAPFQAFDALRHFDIIRQTLIAAEFDAFLLYPFNQVVYRWAHTSYVFKEVRHALIPSSVFAYIFLMIP